MHLISANCLKTTGEEETQQKPLTGVHVCSGCTLHAVLSGNRRHNRKAVEAASAALVLIDIPADKPEYLNATKLCYLARESAEISG